MGVDRVENTLKRLRIGFHTKQRIGHGTMILIPSIGITGTDDRGQPDQRPLKKGEKSDVGGEELGATCGKKRVGRIK